MYFPYLRGKQFELSALLNVNPRVYRNTVPIIEPVKITGGVYPGLVKKLAQAGFPFVLVTNPQHGDLDVATVQGGLIDSALAAHPSVTLGFIVHQHFNLPDLRTFLRDNPTHAKALIFRFTPTPPVLSSIESLVRPANLSYIFFDEKKAMPPVRAAMAWHPNQVMITDGFQRQDRNADYPSSSAFYTLVHSWRSMGLTGMGDYLTIGDNFSDGGGPVYVVALHLTTHSPASGVEVMHFASTTSSSVKGLPAPKFSEASAALVADPTVRRMATSLGSTGIAMYDYWNSTSHFPQLGQAKQASLQHHIELMSSLV